MTEALPVSASTTGWTSGWWVLVPVVAAAITHAPLLRGYFYGDDFIHLFTFANDRLLDTMLTPFGGHMEAFRNLVFYLCLRAFGFGEGTGYYAVVLALHLANVVLVCELIGCSTGEPILGALGGLLFGISAGDIGALEWLSAMGYVLACTLVLTAILVLDPRRERPGAEGRWRALVFAAAMCLVSQSFGVGTAIALGSPVIALTLAPWHYRRTVDRVLLLVPPAFVVVGARVMYLWVLDPHQDVSREAPIMLGFATDARHVLPLAYHLLTAGAATLAGNAAYPLSSYPSRGGTILALVVWSLVAAAVVLRRGPRIAVGLAVATGTAYFSIAAARATLAAGFLDNGIVRLVEISSRYHYLPHATLAVLACSGFAAVMGHLGIRAGLWRAAVCVGAVALIAVRSLWGPALDLHMAQRARVAAIRAAIVEAVRTGPPGSTVCIPNQWDGLVGVLRGQTVMDLPGWAGVFLLAFPEDTVEGRRVFFVTDDSRAFARVRPGSRLARLLVRPGECPVDPDAPSPEGRRAGQSS